MFLSSNFSGRVRLGVSIGISGVARVMKLVGQNERRRRDRDSYIGGRRVQGMLPKEIFISRTDVEKSAHAISGS